MTTEATLRDWRFGQTQAERMCAGILSIEGYAAVDPQHPLGGRDGLKDVVCRRGVTTFVAAAYFPTTPGSFKEVQQKFEADFAGVEANDARGFVFFTNHRLTIGERKALRTAAEVVTDQVEIYHLERLRAVLDTPQGCGLRLEYLRIPMTPEEQVAFWSSANLDIAGRLERIEAMQMRTLHRLEEGNERLLNRTSAMFMDLRSDLSSGLAPLPARQRVWQGNPATSEIDVPMILWIHHIALKDSALPDTLIGSPRQMVVSVDSLTPATGVFNPPPPEEVPERLSGWCTRWRDGYADLLAMDYKSRIAGIASAYHAFLSIHPFADGNGRVGRVLLDQMLRELIGRSLPQSFVDARLELQVALRAADNGDPIPLRELLAGSLS